MKAQTEAEMEIANAEQAAAWNGHEGEHWTEYADRYERASRRVWQRFLDAGLISSTDVVLDVGCGTGTSTRDAARIARRIERRLGAINAGCWKGRASRRALRPGMDGT